MKTDNFLRTFFVGEVAYIATARPAQYKREHGTPKYFIQIWKMTKPTAGILYAPTISGWSVPSVQGYSIRSMNLNVEYSRFLEDFKAYESNKVVKVTA